MEVVGGERGWWCGGGGRGWGEGGGVRRGWCGEGVVGGKGWEFALCQGLLSSDVFDSLFTSGAT